MYVLLYSIIIKVHFLSMEGFFLKLYTYLSIYTHTYIWHQWNIILCNTESSIFNYIKGSFKSHVRNCFSEYYHTNLDEGRSFYSEKLAHASDSCSVHFRQNCPKFSKPWRILGIKKPIQGKYILN